VHSKDENSLPFFLNSQESGMSPRSVARHLGATLFLSKPATAAPGECPAQSNRAALCIPQTVLNMLVTVCLGFPALQIQAQEVPIPEINQPVTDTVGILEQSTVDKLNDQILKLEKDKGSQIAVIIVPTTGEESIEEYGIRAGEKLKIGRKDVDDGVILIVAQQDRKVRIEVGYGLEGAIPDAVANRIIQDRIVPAFRAGNYGTGIEDAVNTLDKIIRGEVLPEPVQQSEDEFVLFSVFSLIGSIFLLVGSLIPLIAGRWLSIVTFIMAALVGLFVYFMTDMFALALFLSGIVAFFIGIFGTIMIAAKGSGGGASSSSSSYSSSSSSSSFSSGFSSSSSFSGGGGSFGGGGASGSW